MKIKITVKPNSRRNEVAKAADGSIIVRVNAPPIEGKANEKVIELLSEYFDKPKRCFSIMTGFKRRDKIIEIS